MLAYMLKVLMWWAASIIKFLFTPFVMMSSPENWSWLEIILITTSGGAIGSFVFYHFGEFLMHQWAKRFPTKKKVFTPMRRRIIRLKTKYGIKGLMLVSVLISVPVSSILTARFYKHDKSALPKLIFGFFLWSIVLTSIAYSFRILGNQL